VNTLAGRGYIEVYREGNKKVAKYVKGLYRGLRKTAPSEEGYKLAKKVLLYYARRGYIVAPVRQDPGLSSRPDLVAVPVDKSTWRPIYSKAIAVEVESRNEVETHPEQVSHNWVKESVKDFAEVHTWIWDTCFDKLRQVYEKAGVDKAKEKIFNAKPAPEKPVGAKATQQPLKPHEVSPETREEKSSQIRKPIIHQEPTMEPKPRQERTSRASKTSREDLLTPLIVDNNPRLRGLNPITPPSEYSQHPC